MQALHVPTGKRCTIMRDDGDRCFCDFGTCANPFTWVKRDELIICIGG